MDWSARFDAFVAKKTAAAVDAHIPGYRTVEADAAAFRLSGIGNAWTMERFDGRFFESWPSDRSLPAINSVFVQSADGNTGAAATSRSTRPCSTTCRNCGSSS